LDPTLSSPIPKAKLRWRCRRGTKELDALLQGFLERHYDHLSPEDQALFAEFLEYSDPDIQNCLLGRSNPIPDDMKGLVRRILE
jgi:antitoxin CptB